MSSREPRTPRHPDNPWSRLVFGVSLLAIGLIFWLDRIDRLDAGDYLRWWPLVIVAFGVAYLAQRRWVAAAISIVIGIAFLPELPFLPHFRLGELFGLWPLLISAGGATLIRQALHPEAKDAPGAGGFRAFALMGGGERTVSSDNFVGGDSIVVMGASEINLSHASITGTAVIDVLAFWGGIEIRIPRGWRVESHVLELLGGFTDKTIPPVADDAPRLIIRGASIMSGIEVRHPKEVLP
jgi:hypothetical protein